MTDWIDLRKSRPYHGETVLVASKYHMAICVACIHGEECPESCQHNNGDVSFYSTEVEDRTLSDPTHFARIRNPNESLQ